MVFGKTSEAVLLTEKLAILVTWSDFSPQQKLQGEKSPKNINDTLKELFGIIPADGDPLQERGTLTCRRCAVVGNSGNLRQSQYGQEIDSHDFVLR